MYSNSHGSIKIFVCASVSLNADINMVVIFYRDNNIILTLINVCFFASVGGESIPVEEFTSKNDPRCKFEIC